MTARFGRSGGRGSGSCDEVAAAVEGLVRRYGLSVSSAPGLLALVELLAGDAHAPSAVRDRRAAVDVHLADSLVALELDEVGRAGKVADIGSGAGFPGLPLAVALPQMRLTLVEASLRRAAYLQRAVAATGVSNAVVVNGRVEEWSQGLGACDMVVARALAPLPVVVEYAAPLLRVGGTLVAWRGRRDNEAERAGAQAAAEVGLEPSSPRRVAPYRDAEHRYLHVMSKVRDTPARFPRRPGVALKRPLGGSERSGIRHG